MKRTTILVFVLTLTLMSPTSHAHKVGNGGDYLRATFISMGKSVLSYLNDTKDGQRVVAQNNLNMSDLESSLDINKISVTDAVLKDNTGSIVDALGVPSLITLNSNAWFDHYQNARDVYYLVFHEMLRSSDVDDDNYKISAALKSFPISMRVETRIVPTVPLMEEDRLSGILNDKAIAMAGSGCKSNDQEIVSELNEEKNIFQISMKNYRVSLEAGRGVEIKNCSLAIPVKVPANKRVVVSLIDLGGDFSLQAGTSAKVRFEAFLTGGQQKALEKNLARESAQSNSFLMRKTDVLKSTCGGNDIMRLNSNIVARSSVDKKEYVGIKSISLYLALEDCKK